MTTHTANLSVDETVRRYMKASKELRKEFKENPEKAKEFLIEAGIMQRSKTHPSGIELVPDLRSKE